MTIIANGAYAQILAVASADVSKSAAITADGVARDLTGSTLTIYVKDDQGESGGYGSSGSNQIIEIPQTITDATAGLFTFFIPHSSWKDKEGEELSYELILTENAIDSCLARGVIVLEGVA